MSLFGNDGMTDSAAVFGKQLSRLADGIKTAVREDVINKACFDLSDTIKATTPKDTGRAQAGWQESVSPSMFSIFNNVEYITYLENGSSRQAPNGMVAVALSGFAAKFKAYSNSAGF